MQKKIYTLLIIVSLIASALCGILLGIAYEKKQSYLSIVTMIDYETLQEKISNNESFLLDVSRVSCRYCAVTEEQLAIAATERKLKVYVLDMELYHHTDKYDQIKKELGIDFVPTFFYYENGIRKYAMNSPINDHYFDEDKTNEDRQQERATGLSKIRAFINGAVGAGPAVDEELYKDNETVSTEE